MARNTQRVPIVGLTLACALLLGACGSDSTTPGADAGASGAAGANAGAGGDAGVEAGTGGQAGGKAGSSGSAGHAGSTGGSGGGQADAAGTGGGTAGSGGAPPIGTLYYVDCSQAADGDGTFLSPWNNVTSVNTHSFDAGDDIYFMAGTTCKLQAAANQDHLDLSGLDGTPDDQAVVGCCWDDNGAPRYSCTTKAKSRPILRGNRQEQDGDDVPMGEWSALIQKNNAGDDAVHGYLTIQEIEVLDSAASGMVFLAGGYGNTGHGTDLKVIDSVISFAHADAADIVRYANISIESNTVHDVAMTGLGSGIVLTTESR